MLLIDQWCMSVLKYVIIWSMMCLCLRMCDTTQWRAMEGMDGWNKIFAKNQLENALKYLGKAKFKVQLKFCQIILNLYYNVCIKFYSINRSLWILYFFFQNVLSVAPYCVRSHVSLVDGWRLSLKMCL